MKKTYIQPQTVALELAATTMLATSNQPNVMHDTYADEELTNKYENTGYNNFWE